MDEQPTLLGMGAARRAEAAPVQDGDTKDPATVEANLRPRCSSGASMKAHTCAIPEPESRA